MRTRIFKDDLLKNYQFVNESDYNRSGFYHLSALLENGREIARNKIQYYNRTWESYTFQSSMSGVVYDLIEKRTNELKDEFKANKGISKLTKKYQDEFQEFVDNDKDIIIYRIMRNELRDGASYGLEIYGGVI